MKKKISSVVAGVCLVILQTACGGGGGPAAPTAPLASSPSPSPSPVVVGPIDRALVGRWVGILSGSLGPAELVMQLDADGSGWFEGTGRYCRAVGNWGVSGSGFTAQGSDCTGTVVTMVAPASSTSMTGTWTATSGRRGEFSATRD